MAGGKETPRQKMIGLMYLVLLAMLALQVSSAIIKKFQDINVSLEEGVATNEFRNKSELGTIALMVSNAKNNKEDMKVLESAKDVRAKSEEILAYIRKHKEELIEKGGGKDEHGNFEGAKEEEPVAQYMIGTGDTQNGQAYTLKTKLNEYVSYLNGVYEKLGVKKTYPSLALDAKEDNKYKNDPEQKNKDFAHLNFESTPLAAAVTILSEKEYKILNLENEVLNHLKSKLSSEVINVDKIRPVVRSNAKYVVAGTPYEAEMFMAAYSSKITPEMTFNEKELEVSANGSAEIKFNAAGGGYNSDGIAKKIWKGTIKYPKANGEDTVYNIEQEYYVVKPAIQVQAGAVSTLYRNCGNQLNIQVPALGADYNPTFRITGGRIINGNQTGKIMVVPSSPNVKVSVYNKGTFIGEQNFKVMLVPKPDISVNLDERRPIASAKLSGLRIKATPDAGFKTINPRDASCSVTRYDAFLVRNGRLVKKVEARGSTGVALRQLQAEARKNDTVIIEVKEVKRKKFSGGKEVINMPTKYFKFLIQ